jgi:hypothetical protein
MAVISFWAELKQLQDARPETVTVPPAQRGEGWCDKCQSYCYGDCEANQ